MPRPTTRPIGATLPTMRGRGLPALALLLALLAFGCGEGRDDGGGAGGAGGQGGGNDDSGAEVLTTVASRFPSSIGLTADAVWWTQEGGTVWAVSKQGGAPAAVTNNTDDATHRAGNLLIDATHAYWANWIENGALMRLPVDASVAQPSTLVEGASPIARALHGGFLYYSHWKLATLWRIPVQGGDATVAAELPALLGGCAQDGALLFCTQPGGEIVEIDLPSGEARTVLAASAVSPSWLAVDASHVYFIDGAAGAVVRVPRIGGAAETVASGQDEPSALAVDGAFIYWVAEVVANPQFPYFIHTIVRAPKAGGPVEVFVSNHCPPDLCEVVVFRPVGLVFDATHVYWASRESEGSAAVIARARK